jgi:S-formylglutathione hydrolase
VSALTCTEQHVITKASAQAHAARHGVIVVASGLSEQLPLLVDQGEADEFLATQLRPELLAAACQATGHPLTLRMQPVYDHSYYFIATFLGDHFEHHGRFRSP